MKLWIVLLTKKWDLSDSQMQMLWMLCTKSEQISLIESAVGMPLACWLQPGELGCRKAATPVKLLHFWIKMTIIIFDSKIMHNFKIGFNFAKHFFKIKPIFWPYLMTKHHKWFYFEKKSIFTLTTHGLIYRDLINK